MRNFDILSPSCNNLYLLAAFKQAAEAKPLKVGENKWLHTVPLSAFVNLRAELIIKCFWSFRQMQFKFLRISSSMLFPGEITVLPAV
jgi:hypothetical protein